MNKNIKTLDDVIGYIFSQLNTEDIEEIKNTEEEYSIICLNGMGIRNEFNLWNKSDLSMWFYNHGVYHADDMSGIICKAVWCAVKNVNFNLEQEISYYQNYWKNIGVDVKSEFEKCEAEQ